MAKYAHITGWGKSLPRKVVTNFDLEKMVDTSDAWIQEHTGIRERRIAGPGEYVSTLSVAASQQALERAGMSPTDLDLIIPGHLLARLSDAGGSDSASSRAWRHTRRGL